MMLALKSGPQIAAKVGNPAGLLCRRIWYSVGKSGVLGITEYRQGRPLKMNGQKKISTNHYNIPIEKSLMIKFRPYHVGVKSMRCANYEFRRLESIDCITNILFFLLREINWDRANYISAEDTNLKMNGQKKLSTNYYSTSIEK